MSHKKFCIIGLGFFGENLAIELANAGAEVLAIDNHQEKIDIISEKVTHAVCMDSTDGNTLQGFNLENMDAVIVAIGEGFESSIITTAHLQALGVKRILNRVTSKIHERLLKLMNVDELLVPEAEAAKHLASRLMIEGLITSHEISKEYGIFEILAPKNFIGKKIIDTKFREKYKMNLVTIKRTVKKSSLLTLKETYQIEVLGVTEPNTIILEGDTLVLFGSFHNIEEVIGRE